MTNTEAPLRPDSSIQKALISSTCRFIGEHESDAILISHAWQHSATSNGIIREEESPASRNAFIVAFRTEAPNKKEIVIPDYSFVGDTICSCLAVLFGKRFDNHGLTEGSGFYRTPDLSHYNSICNHRLIFNSHQPRKCFHIPLNLAHASVFDALFTDPSVEASFKSKFQAASKFYLQALQNAEIEPEIAYLHLITAGEIISDYYEFQKEELIDELMHSNLEKIRTQLVDGEKVAKQVLSRIFSVKKRFVKSLCSLVDDDFFLNTEIDLQYGCFSPDDFEKRIGAAYDLRSKYVHTGVPFGMWVQPNNQGCDIQLGKPVVDDKEYAKILAKAPTFTGLERVIRYCILKFLCSNGFELKSLGEKSGNEV